MLIEKLAERAAATQPGDPLDPASGMGAMVDTRHAANVMSFIEAGRKTARLVAGGEQVTINGRGSFVQPTIFDDVTPDDPLARDEIFDPVLWVIGFDDEEEAVRVANDSVYGLAASLWTDSLSRAHPIAGRLRVGTVSVNTVDALSPMPPSAASSGPASVGIYHCIRSINTQRSRRPGSGIDRRSSLIQMSKQEE